MKYVTHSLFAVAVSLALASSANAADKPDDNPVKGSAVDLGKLIATLKPEQRALYQLKDEAAKTTIAYQKASEEAGKRREEFAKERNKLNRPQNPGESPAAFRDWQREQTQKVNALDKQYREEKAKADMLGYKKNVAMSNVERFTAANPTVKLPAPLDNHIESVRVGKPLTHGVGGPVYQSAKDALNNSRGVYDGGDTKTVDLRPPASGSAQRDAEAKRKADEEYYRQLQKQQEQQALDLEAKEIVAEANRLVRRRTQLDALVADLDSRIAQHNANKPDPYNHAAVNAYNQRAGSLNAELRKLKADCASHDAAVARLQQRGRTFDGKLKEFGRKWSGAR